MDPVEEKRQKNIWRKRWRAFVIWLPLFVWKWATRLYYRMEYLIIHKWRVREFFFINYWVVAFLGLTVILLYTFLHKGTLYLAFPTLSGDSYERDHHIPAQADHPFRAKLTRAFRGKLTTTNV